MKITLENAVLGFMALQRVGVEKFPIKLAYTLQRNMRILQPDTKQYEDQRMELVKTKYGKENEEGGWEIPPEKRKAFEKQIETLGSVELELDLHTIDLDTVNINISPNDLYALEWMFVVGASEDAPKPIKKRGKNG